MVNPFLSSKNYDTKTAVMLERANIIDIGNAVAYTDGERVFINIPENLEKILPAYDDNMLKLLLWHEQMHMEFKHHRRYFKYVETMKKSTEEIAEKFNISKEEVNIIMDILVHDWLLEKYPELTDTAKKNLAQLRYRNALKFTFKTYTLEEMLTEYADFKKDCPPTEGGQGEGESDEQEKSDEQEQQENQKSKSNKKNDKLLHLILKHKKLKMKKRRVNKNPHLKQQSMIKPIGANLITGTVKNLLQNKKAMITLTR